MQMNSRGHQWMNATASAPSGSATPTAASSSPHPAVASAPHPSTVQPSALGMLLGLAPASAPVPTSAPSPASPRPSHVSSTPPTLTLLPPPPSATAFPALPALFTSRRADGRRQGIMLNVKGGGAGMDMRSSLAAFRAQLGRAAASLGVVRDDEDDDDSDGEQEQKSAPRGQRRSHASHSHRGHAPTPSVTAPPPSGRKSSSRAATLRPSQVQQSQAQRDSTHGDAGARPTTKVKVVMKGVRSLPATSLAGIKQQQVAQAQAEEKQNHAVHAVHAVRQSHAARAGMRRGGASIGGSGFLAGMGSSIPSNLPKDANLLLYLTNEELRTGLPMNVVDRLFGQYCSDPGSGKLKRDDLSRLAMDILQRIKMLLSSELSKQSGLTPGSSDLQRAAQQELSFMVKGKNDEERKMSIINIMLHKAQAKSAAISKAAFLQVWGSLCADLFTVRTDGALGCIIC